MYSILRMMPRLAVAAGVAAALWSVSPATAAEPDASAKQSVKAASAPVKHHHRWPRSWYGSHVHDADAGTSARQCYWFCGRPFVLMVGIGY